MIILILLTVLSLPSQSASDSQYECGSHGRFEYCIDGIPGCVVGCHCHPGYYFDTDTKICEPNVKLTQDFRRHYLSEPTRIHDIQFIPPTIANYEPTVTTKNPIDNKIDEITNDADDIGDWLYNQFFKTIENQVINNTNGDELLTRRSGSSSHVMKPKRRSNKHRKRIKKKKHKKSLKSKLLRITEDDSLFDSSSSSNSNEDSSSSSSSESDTSKNKKDHGHRKIVIFNKKPKPPLPSFIFLPNIETPFYPPIGLPPPPAVPMYPMVPVPPMGPIFVYPGLTPKPEDNEATTVSTIVTTTDSIFSSTSSSIPLDSKSDDSAMIGNKKNLRGQGSHGFKFKAKKPKLQEKLSKKAGNETETMLWNNFKQGPRNKFMQKLRQKMKKTNSKPNIDQYQDAESPLLDIDMPPDLLLNANSFKSNIEDDGSPRHEDVNFKYLTQLIHRVDANKTKPAALPFRQNNKINKNQIPQRRMNNFYDSNVVPVYSQPSERMVESRTSNWNELNDSYYSNLGRQIATMVRNIDTKGERQVNIEIEQANSQSPSNPLFNENSYAPRSYWERSVRSPLRYYNTYTDEFSFFRKSNENLFSLENKVEIAASTARSLSLQELENIINTFGKAQIPRKNRYFNNSNSSKINRFSLLPESEQSRNENRNFMKIDNRNDTILYLNTMKPYKLQANNSGRSASILTKNLRGLMSRTNRKTTNPEKHKNIFYNMKPTRKPNKIRLLTNDSLLNKIYMPQPVLRRNINTPYIKVTQKPDSKFQLNPMTLNYRGLNYYFKNKNHYLVEKGTYPRQYPNVFKHLKQFGQPARPSYFHHEVHHFDYFDK